MTKKPIVILGGGPTGLAAAYKLAQMKKKFILLEKENYLGGLSATLKHGHLSYEFGPHAFHLKDPQITTWLKKLLGKDFRIISTHTKVLIDGKLLNYPLSAGELLKKIKPTLGFRIIFEYFYAYLKSIVKPQKIVSFQDWGLQNFGPTLYKLSFGDFTKKVWGIDPKELSYRLATNKLSRLNLADILLNLLGFKGKDQPAYFKKYLYPVDGARKIFESMAQTIRKQGEILLGAKVLFLKSKNNQIYAVEYQDKAGQKHQLDCQQVISTLAPKDVFAMINHPLARELVSAAKQLDYRGLIIVYLVVQDDNLPDAQWIYLVEDKFRGNRLAINKNLSPEFVKKRKTILAFEISASRSDELWQAADVKLLEMAKADLRRLGLENLEIFDYFVKRLDDAYPIYRLAYEKKLRLVLDEINKISNLISTGRNGLFLNSDIHDSFQMGFEAAQIVTRKKVKNG